MASSKKKTNVNEEKEQRLESYLNNISNFPELELGVSPVLYSIVLTIISENEIDNENENENENNSKDIITSSYSKESFPLLNDIKLYPPYVQMTNDLLLLETDDDQAARFARANKLKDVIENIENIENNQNPYLDLYIFERNAYAQMLINRMIDADIFPEVPTMTNEERKLRETEVLTFTSLSASDFYRCDKMQIFEDMVQKCTAKLPNFSKKINLASDSTITRRKYFRHTSKFIFPQILSKNMIKEPKILKSYYPYLDELLFVLHWVPPIRRMGNSTWKLPDHLLESKEPKIKNKSKKHKSIDNILDITKEDTITITPAGNAIVLSKYVQSTNHSWISIYLNDSILGLRNLGEAIANPPPNTDEAQIQQPSSEMEGGDQDEEKAEEGEENEGEEEKPEEELNMISEPTKDSNSGCSFFLETSDDVRYTVFAGPKPETIVKPDKYGTVCLMVVMPSILTITACSNGMVRMASTPKTIVNDESLSLNSNPWGTESARYISNGNITRQLKDSLYRKDVICPNGSRILYRAIEEPNILLSESDDFHNIIKMNAPPEWDSVRLGSDGTTSFLDKNKKEIIHEISLVPDDIIRVFIDAETLARVTRCLDGRVITDYADGLKEVVIIDGTRIVTHSSGNVVYITKSGYPSVEVDVEIDVMCDGHSKGLQVALSKGGFKVRTRMVMPDGSAMMIKYDTRVTAKTNGTLKLVRRDKSVIIANDDGNATYFPRYSWNSSAEKEFEEENKDTTITIDKGTITEASHGKMLKSTASTVKFNVDGGTSGIDMNINASQSTLLRESTSNFSTKFKSPKEEASLIISENEKHSKHSKTSKILTDSLLQDKSISEMSSKTSNRKILDAKYKFNIYNYTTSIIDHEYNSFELSLRDPLTPKRSLAGEVQGLKATAISDGPIEPRAFILNRKGETIEVISSQLITTQEDIIELSPDASKFVSEAPMQPADFSSSMQNNYFRRRKLGSTDDFYSFDEIFKPRPWHNRKKPATTSLNLATLSNLNKKSSHHKHAHKSNDLSPRIFDTYGVLEQNPLSIEGYKQLNNGMNSYEQFKLSRLDAIHRFTIHDPRSNEEIEIESKVRNKVKLAYKAMMKKLEQQNKDEEKKADNDNADDFPPFVEEEEKPEDPETIEIRDAFNSYASSPSNTTITFENIRLALIQIFNMNIKNETIMSFLDEDTFSSLKTNASISFSFLKFSDLYFKMKNIIMDSDKKLSDYSVSVTDDNEVDYNEFEENKRSIIDDPTSPKSETSYWNSSAGKDINVPRSAAPLDLRPLDWNLNGTSLHDDFTTE